MIDFLFAIMILILATVTSIMSHESGVVTENTRIYETCIQKNSELSVTKANELCKEIVK